MATLFIMVGISGSGKSTYAKAIELQLKQKGSEVGIVSTDEIRGEICGGNQSDQSKNSEVFKIAHSRIEEILSLGVNVIFDATNLARDDRKIPIKIARENGAKVVAIVLNTPLTVSIERNRTRERVVPTPVIWRQQGRFHSPTPDEVDEVLHINLNTPFPNASAA